ncbi:beta-ketoacyl synthase N-terminal-like domain-containing protein [Amycolatopsis sp.]|uniref:beta-ketoacyl synthase N-terminal-like domain-containing protein n=1 Tax=Amycolatopsis sp. TaxID=37632 RepID=UPI002D7F64EE|nr:beta-ketoacyl synthase N-terminal-like domain-containing protein [Amycolatopsis sp.]HET6706959.1 beta-ketoacyl synthase N-terminal-like domain-containing protein [Amycolatopsis sp.]
MQQPETITDVLRRHAAERPDRIGFRFLEYPDTGETVVSELSYGRLDAWARAVAVTLGEHTVPGDRVLLLCPPGPEYLAYFFGCLYARRIAVPAYPPGGSRHTGRIEAIARDADARLLVLGGPGDVPAGDDPLGLLPRVLATHDVVDGRQDDWTDGGGRAQDVAFLQYTSGSTADPKGVMVSHGNLVANSRTAELSFGFGPDSSAVSWLPPYHDMGLIGGIVFPLYTGFPMALMSPLAFLRDPVRWLDAVTRFRATASTGPTFAYDLCCDRVGEERKDRIDLSSWTCALNGAEPIRADVLDRFAAAFARCGFRRSAFHPCYGLAEGTLVVSGTPTGDGPKVRLVSKPALAAGQVRLPESAGTAVALVGSGAVAAGLDVVVVDRETRSPVPDGQVGEIWVRGPSVSSGYFGAEEATARTFGGRLADGSGPYLRTGDLGVFVEGELFVTGRAGDLMIFQGRNVYPQDIEATAVRSHPLLRATRAAAFSVPVDGEERLVVVQEVARPRVTAGELAELTSAIRQAVTGEHGLGIHELVLVAPRKIPVTSSGKVRRKACRAGYLEGALARVRPRARPATAPARPATEPARPVAVPDQPTTEPARPTTEAARPADLEARVRQFLARQAGRPAEEIDLGRPLTDYGLGSVHAAALAAELSGRLGTEVPVTFAWEHETIADALRSLTTGAAAPRRAPTPPAAAAEAIAVVGVGCRFPGAALGTGADGFWDLLAGGGSGIGEIPGDRWDVDGLFSPEPGSPGKVYTRHGGFVDGVGSFDGGLFGVSPREAASMDPQQGLVLEVAWEALEAAGIAPDSLRGTRTGVFMGVGGSDFERLGAVPLDGYAASGSAVNFVANRLSFELGLMGPSLSLDTACSSSLVAVHLAVRSLRDGECDTALAGGVNLLLSPDVWVALCGARMLSPRGACRTFDAGADGYVRGEGCGVIVLKRQSDVTAHDTVLAVIRGTAVNHDGRSNGLTAPNGAAQQDVIRTALHRAGVAPAEVGYVEAHGTGTPLGDPIELRALAGVLGENRPTERPVTVGSVKTNIGHLEAAAGIAGLIKTILTVHNGLIPPHLNLRDPNPAVTWAELPVRVPTKPTAWNENRRIAGVSSFGFGGTNAHAVIENAVADGG